MALYGVFAVKQQFFPRANSKKMYELICSTFFTATENYLAGVSLPLFQCTVCGRKKRLDFEVSCTGDAKRNLEKAPWCCGKEMTETIDD
jgi:hypothetical protein